MKYAIVNYIAWKQIS